MKKVTVFGGSGFIGSYIIAELAKSGYVITIVSRNIDSASQLKLCGNPGQITPVYGDVLKVKDIEENTKDAQIVINLVGILEEKRNLTFNSIHHNAAKNIAKAAKKNDVKRLIHFSALANGTTKYGASKIQGEVAALSEFPDAIIVRPGVVFGEEDKFFNLFAKIIKKTRMFPLVCCGKTLIQPVYVGDIAKFVSTVLKNEEIKAKSYDIVGPKKYSLKEIMLFIQDTLEIKCLLIPLPYYLALAKAFFLEFKILKPLNKLLTGATGAMLTRDQARMLCFDNVSDKNGLTELEIEPTTIEEIVPKYLKALS